MSDPQTPVRIGHVLILPDGTRKPLSPAVDEAHEDATGATVIVHDAFGVPVPLNLTSDPDEPEEEQ